MVLTQNTWAVKGFWAFHGVLGTCCLGRPRAAEPPRLHENSSGSQASCHRLRGPQETPGQPQRTWALLGFPRVRLSSAAHQHVTSTGHSAPLEMSLGLLPGAGEDTGRAVLSPALTGHRVGTHRCAGTPVSLCPALPPCPQPPLQGAGHHGGRSSAWPPFPSKTPTSCYARTTRSPPHSEFSSRGRRPRQDLEEEAAPPFL